MLQLMFINYMCQCTFYKRQSGLALWPEYP
jgi:hypothetical protein